MLGICFIDKFSIKTLAIVERLGTYYKIFSAVIKTGNQNKRKRMERFEALRQLLSEDRSIRRFEQSRRIGMEILTELVDLTRFCASGRNMQPLRYRIVDSEAGPDISRTGTVRKMENARRHILSSVLTRDMAATACVTTVCNFRLSPSERDRSG